MILKNTLEFLFPSIFRFEMTVDNGRFFALSYFILRYLKYLMDSVGEVASTMVKPGIEPHIYVSKEAWAFAVRKIFLGSNVLGFQAKTP